MNPNTFQSLPVPSSDEIREILVRRIEHQQQAVGIVVGVIEPNGRRVVAHGNLANADSRSVDGDTIFEIGSVTKVFTSLLLADMVERHEVALGDPADTYLPGHVRMPERSGTSITLLDLATHASGLPRLPDNLTPRDAANPYVDYGVDDLYRFLSGYTLPRDPGSEIEYSNLGAGLLGHLLARRGDTDYESLIRSRITQPLNMRDTGITLSPSMTERMATGHNMFLAPVANWDFPTLAGAGALRSSANDMLTFLEAFLGYTESPLAPAMNAMLDVRRPIGDSKFKIGMGWGVVGALAWHDGGTGGFRSFVACDRKARTGVVVLSNTFTPSGVEDIGLHLLNPSLPLASPKSVQSPSPHTEICIDPTLLDNYTGRYQLAPDRIFEISRDGGRLFAQGGTQSAGPMVGPKFELFAESEKDFFVKATGSRITFETGSGGRATGLVMRRVGREPISAVRIPAVISSV
jgi:D-alanyl-D-alanine-carboxypeptidase/D-alanyl-D-alanine-endopeptidase